MRTPFLPIFIDNAETELEGLQHHKPFDQCAWQDIKERLIRLRKLGIGRYLLNGSSQAFFAQLNQVWTLYLRYLHTQPDPKPPSGLGFGFYDAIICRQFDSARQIASLSRMDWYKGFEFPDDAAFVQFVMAVLDASDTTLISDRFTKLENLQNPKNAHLIAVAESLLKRDNDLFGIALLEMLQAHADYYQQLNESGGINEDDYTLFGSIDLTALAILQVGRSLGFAVEAEYRGLPAPLWR